MKKLLLVGAVIMSFSGCGLSLIQKQKLADGLIAAKGKVDTTCASAPGVLDALNGLIDSYTK